MGSLDHYRVHDYRKLTAYSCLMLSAWLFMSPLSMGFMGQASATNDFICATLLAGFSFLTLWRDNNWSRWPIGAIGLWLTFAPLVFWTPSPAAYANDTLVGTLIMISSLVIPSFYHPVEQGSTHPSGWSYNPSDWSQRVSVIGLALTGFLVARYLSAYQLGHISSVWDPFFGNGTEQVLNSKISKSFPISDAGLGAWSYLMDALFGAFGGIRRWRTAPWIVLLFGLMVIPPGATSISLVILQPVAVGSWCTLCLVTAAIMLLMIPPALDEVMASLQGLVLARKRGYSFWKACFFGIPEELILDPKTYYELPNRSQVKHRPSMAWNLVLCGIIGIWCMAMPAVFNLRGLASDFNHLIGAFVVTVSVIALAQVARPVRFLNCLWALLIASSALWLPDQSTRYDLCALVTGLSLFFLALPLGKINDRFGSYDALVEWNPGQMKKAS